MSAVAKKKKKKKIQFHLNFVFLLNKFRDLPKITFLSPKST